MTAVAPLGPTERIVLRMIEAAVNAGEECPCNQAITDRIGYSSVSTAAKILGAIETKGWIRVERFQAGRQVTIVATGRATRWDHSRSPHWRASSAVRSGARGYVRQALPTAAQTFVVLDRDPCFRCGVRADIGCAHQRAAEPEELVA